MLTELCRPEILSIIYLHFSGSSSSYTFSSYSWYSWSWRFILSISSCEFHFPIPLSRRMGLLSASSDIIFQIRLWQIPTLLPQCCCFSVGWCFRCFWWPHCTLTSPLCYPFLSTLRFYLASFLSSMWWWFLSSNHFPDTLLQYQE